MPDRFSRFNEAAPADSPAEHLPWTVRRNTNPDDSPHLFQQESFVCVCGETSLPADSPEDFLDKAVDFVNDRLWGTLATALTVPRGLSADRLDTPSDALAPRHHRNQSVAGRSLRADVALVGGFPNRDLGDVQSGIGSVHNTFLLNRPEKTVLRSPLKMFPKPMWFSTHHDPRSVAWKLLELYESPRLSRLPPLLLCADPRPMRLQVRRGEPPVFRPRQSCGSPAPSPNAVKHFKSRKTHRFQAFVLLLRSMSASLSCETYGNFVNCRLEMLNGVAPHPDPLPRVRGRGHLAVTDPAE